jgi:hypothetical protein
LSDFQIERTVRIWEQKVKEKISGSNREGITTRGRETDCPERD